MTTKKNTRRPHGDGSIYRDAKKGRWIAQFNVGYDGRTGRLIKRTRTCRTQKEARAALEELSLKYANPGALTADHLTVKKWLTSWFDLYSRPQTGHSDHLPYAAPRYGQPHESLTSL